MIEVKAVLRWVQSLVTAALAIALAYVAEAVQAFDASTVTHDPLAAAIAVAVVATVGRFTGWLVGKLPS